MDTGCLANLKGGAGKTTNTIHLGARLAALKKRVLLIDFDKQMDLTAGTGAYENDYNVVDFLEGNGPLSPVQRSKNLFILPGNPNFIASKYTPDVLRNALKPYSKHFDFVLIDTPPADINEKDLTNAEIALMASTFFMIPIQPTTYSIKNSNSFLGSVHAKVTPKNKDLKFLGFFFSNILVTKKSVEVWRNFMEEKAGDHLFDSFIRTDAQVEEAVDEGLTIFQYNPQCRASLDYMSLTKEFLKRIKQ